MKHYNHGYKTSLAYGNYSSTIQNTGTNKKDKVGNIYDLAGNVREWTTERYKNMKVDRRTGALIEVQDENIYRVIRGGAASFEATPNRSQAVPEDRNDKQTRFKICTIFKIVIL